jgi:hypothetical protein
MIKPISERIQEAVYREIMGLAKTDGYYNPGALSVLHKVFRNGDFKVLDVMEQLGIKGEKVWTVWKDECGENYEVFKEKILTTVSS